MSFLLSQMPWRPPLAADWPVRFDALRASVDELANSQGADAEAGGRSIVIEARRVAGMRLGPIEGVRLGKLAKRLWPLRDRLAPLRPFRLAVVGSRTMSFLCAELPAAGLARGLLIDVAEADYGATAALAMGAAELPLGDNIDATLLYLDPGALIPPGVLLDHAAEAAQIDAASARLTQIVEGLRARLNAPVIVASLALQPESVVASADGAVAGSALRLVGAVNEAIRAGAARGDWLIWDVAGLANDVGAHAWFDPVRWHQAKAPFAVELAPLVADHLCRLLAAMTGKAGRALILDLDNTLWGGVLADDGLEGVRIGQGSMEGEAFLAFQQAILHLRARGVVLAVCSKNNEEVARSAFEQHPDMLLRLEHFAMFQANWLDKATNVKSIAATLNLGLESMVFVDDNPAERARVRQELPLVTVLEMAMEPAFYPRLLAASGAFEHAVLNVDDLNRASAYQAELRRAETLEQVGNYQEYLASLKMRMTIAPFDRLGRARIAQLINKSNQFNLTTRRYNETQVADLESDPNAFGWQARLSDAFGDHGMIGVIIVRKDALVWRIDTWLMSCRVLERGVEQTLMNELVALAAAAGAEQIDGEYLRTDRNGLVEEFFDKMQFERLPGGERADKKRYRLVVADYAPFPSAIDVARVADYRTTPSPS